ncbi:EfeM/EfeO family lipoprotein [Nocardioides sp. Kera G14]|uniref:EfeM/EfeO family lipoprotein n=1 Tax=Nocardioides sp. Kera G14 TaxID=2884264 RepID=UPI001D10646B|nr:EfeM/EfeO family lipoprotein [Nocardioides sp. Kera G14]UDY22619.1 EfeM/EfeO family lipoprotein [Nocardioides sp. Kera G14]
MALVLTVAPYLSGPSQAESPSGDASIPGTPVTVGVSNCGAGWSGGAAGPLNFAVWNSNNAVAEVQVENVDNHKVYALVEDLGVGATRNLSLVLGAGSYRFLCLFGDSPPAASKAWQLTGDYDGSTTPGNEPATDLALTGPNETYTAWVIKQFPGIRGELVALRSAAQRGQLLAARNAWAEAHRRYLLLGAAYDAFGDDGEAIDGDVGVGFPKLESQLWGMSQPTLAVAPAKVPTLKQMLKGKLKGKNAATRAKITRRMRAAHAKALKKAKARQKAQVLATQKAQQQFAASIGGQVVPVINGLLGSLDHLAATFGNPVMPSNIDLGLRTHEILEDALRFEVTGENDHGSHLTLSNIDAMVEATRDIMSPLRSLLVVRDPHLDVTDQWLARLKAYVDSFHHGSTWTPLSALTAAQRRVLNATLSQTLEYLSEIAVILDPVQKGPQ